MSLGLYTEIVGLPGTGKTHATQMIVDHAHAGGHVIHTRTPLQASVVAKIRISLKTLWVLVVHPRVATLWFKVISSEYKNTPHVRWVVRMARSRAIAEAVIVRELMNAGSSPMINDEGIIGKIIVLSVLFECTTDQTLSLLTALLPSQTGIIYIQTHNAVAQERAHDRDTRLPFFDEMDPLLRTQLYESCAEQYTKICTLFSQQEQSMYQVMSNNGSEEELHKEIKDSGLMETGSKTV